MAERSILTLQNFFLIVAASISAVVTFASTSNAKAGLYGLFSMSLFALAFISMGNVPTLLEERQITFLQRITHALPIFPICILAFVLYIIQLEHKDILEGKNLPQSYEVIKILNFIFYIIALLFVASYLDKSNQMMKIKDENIFKNEQICLGTSGAIVVFFSVCAGISTSFMYVVLKYFTTDGYRNLNIDNYKNF